MIPEFDTVLWRQETREQINFELVSMLILGDEVQDVYEIFVKSDPPQAFVCFCQSIYQHCDLVQKVPTSMGLCQKFLKSITSILSLQAISSLVILPSLLYLTQAQSMHSLSIIELPYF